MQDSLTTIMHPYIPGPPSSTKTDCRLLWVNNRGKAINGLFEEARCREDLITALMNSLGGNAAVITWVADGFLARLVREKLLVKASEEERDLYANESDAVAQKEKADAVESELRCHFTKKRREIRLSETSVKIFCKGMIA